MERPYSFHDFLRECPAGKFLDDMTLAVCGAFVTFAWLACLPFAPVVLAFRRRIRGKRYAAAWKRKNGYRCPETFYWWMKYM